MLPFVNFVGSLIKSFLLSFISFYLFFDLETVKNEGLYLLLKQIAGE